MGVYTDLLASGTAKSWDSGHGDGTVAIDRIITKEVKKFLTRQGDLSYPAGFEEADEVQSLAAYNCTVTSGNFTLAVTLRDGTTFTTANIAYDANAATVEGAINTAATGNVTGWTNGDISVALTGDLNANAAALTFDGDSVKLTKQGTSVIADINLKGGSTGTVSTSPQGVVAVNEVQTIGVYKGTVDGGTFTLTLNVNEEAFTTAALQYNDNAATIEGAINTAATGNVTSWTNGDISVSGGDLTSAGVVLTYDGTIVKEKNQAEVVFNDVDLTGVGTPGTVTESVTGAAGTDEVQEIAVYSGTVSGGNFTLTINVVGSAAVTTANILYNADAATIEGAVNTVATGNITGWTNGDITVACTSNLTTDPVTLTYDGESVQGADQVEVIITDVDLSGGGTVGAVSTTTPGVDATDEVQSIATFNGTVSGGNYKLTINVSTDPAFDTANIAHDADASTIEGAVNTAATGNITGWTNGDITVTDGPLTTNAAVLTFDGFSVDGADQVLTIITDVDLTGPGTPGDISTSPGGVTPVNELQSIAVYAVAVTSGNYTLTIEGSGESAVNTANLAHDANAATIEAAIDTACAGYGSWSNGDIAVTGGPMTTNAVVLTFTNSMAGANHVTTLVNDQDLKGGTPGTVSVTTNGQTDRTALAALKVMGLVNSGPPAQGTTGGITTMSTRDSNPWMPSVPALKALALQAAIEDGSDTLYSVIITAMGL